MWTNFRIERAKKEAELKRILEEQKQRRKTEKELQKQRALEEEMAEEEERRKRRLQDEVISYKCFRYYWILKFERLKENKD